MPTIERLGHLASVIYDQQCKCQNGGNCDSTTGQCLCQPGFIGQLCQQACSPGFYGFHCNQKCNCPANECDNQLGCAVGQQLALQSASPHNYGEKSINFISLILLIISCLLLLLIVGILIVVLIRNQKRLVKELKKDTDQPNVEKPIVEFENPNFEFEIPVIYEIVN